MSVKKKLATVAKTKAAWPVPYQAPTSSAFGGTLGAPPPPPPAPAAATTSAAPPDPGAAAGSVQPFYRPEDLLTQNNFWAQWNSTFAGLDHSLADLQTNTAFERAQLSDQHKSNVSGINDDAAARGISHSSIRDGNQATEQTQFTRKDQNLTDALNSFATYVAGQKNDFNTNVLPGFNAAESGQAVQNAQDVNSQYVPPPAPAATPTAVPQVTSQTQQPTTGGGATFTAAPVYKAVVRSGYIWHVYPDGHQVKVKPAS